MSRSTVVPVIAVAQGVIDTLDVERAHAGETADLRLVSASSPTELSEGTAGARALVVNTHPMPRANLEALAPTVDVLVRAGTGLDAIDLDVARDLGLVVYHTPDYCVEEVATHAVAWVFALARRLFPADRIARASFGNWRGVGIIRPLSELRVGVVGAGRIGLRVATMLRPFVASVAVYDPYAAPVDSGFAACVSLESLLEDNDVITLHCPLTAETRGMIGPRELALLPRGAMIVNCSRGGLIDEEALLGALESAHLGGAALDVFADEPLEPAAPLARSDKLGISPHIAWYSTASELRVRTQALDGALAILAGKTPVNGRIAVQQSALRSRA